MTGTNPHFNLRFRRGISAVGVVLTCLVSARAGSAQCTGAVKGGRVAFIAGAYTIGEVSVLALRHSEWWHPPRQSFHTIWGGSPSKGQDGLLHASVSYQASQVAALAWDWACVSPKAAGWLAAATGLAVGIPKEIGDGLHENGFSGPDMIWTAAGALLPAFHRQWPVTRAINWKVFYWPSAEYRNRTGPVPALENDYAGQRYYLSLDAPVVPGLRWLGLAVGHGVPYWSSIPPVHEWYATLNLNFPGLPIHAPWWHKFALVLNQVHVPMPGVRLRDGEWSFGVF